MCLFPRKGYPCGKCIECLSKKRDDWSLRLQFEYEYWRERDRSTYMVLLTYDEDHVPKTSSGTNSLRQRDVQLFMKRLRKDLSRKKIFCRFFYCGEYGPTTLRPHYHMLLFGLPADWDKYDVRWLLEKHWKNGFVGDHIDKVKSTAGIHYCTKYMINKALKLHDPELEKPFTRCSKGLGISFLFRMEEDERGLHKVAQRADVVRRFKQIGDVDSIDPWQRMRELTDPVEIYEFCKWIQKRYIDCVTLGDYRRKIPRYLRTKIFDGCERDLINFADFILHWKPMEDEYQKKYGEYDATHEIPMRTLMAIEKTQRLLSHYIKTSKD